MLIIDYTTIRAALKAIVKAYKILSIIVRVVSML